MGPGKTKLVYYCITMFLCLFGALGASSWHVVLVQARPSVQTSLQQPAPTPTPSAALDSPTIVPAQENAGTIIAPTVQPDVSRQSGELPYTAATVPGMGIGLALLGVAFMLHATRKVRRADAELRDKTTIVRLAPFMRVALRHQQQTAKGLDQAQELLKTRIESED